MRNVISFSGLYNLFFVLSFFFITYATNVYVLFAFAMLFCLFLASNVEYRRILYMYFGSVVLLSLFYFYIHDGGSAYRIFKTVTLIWITFFIPFIQGVKVERSLHYFILCNAFLVYADFLLYNVFGFSMTTPAETHGFMRFSGMIEDSNFFSYLLFTYIYYLKVKTGKFNFFLIGAVLLSFSLSLIIIMVCVFSLLLMKKLWMRPERSIKLLGGVVLITVFLVYYGMLFVLTTFRDVDPGNDYMAEKLVSLSLRFESQLEAFDALAIDQDYFWGIGAGKTKDITTKGMNLHNSYLQVLLEMGICCLLVVFAFGAYCFYFLDKRFVLLFVAIFLLGNILEVFYFPLLSFILFLSVVYKRERDNEAARMKIAISL